MAVEGFVAGKVRVSKERRVTARTNSTVGFLSPTEGGLSPTQSQ